MLNEYFKTTDVSNLNITPEQQKSIKKDFEFVKGKDFYKGYYEQNIVHKVSIRYFQLALFDEHDKRAIRSYLFEGTNTQGGACFYNYKIV